jgi:hypothetical protein
MSFKARTKGSLSRRLSFAEKTKRLNGPNGWVRKSPWTGATRTPVWPLTRFANRQGYFCLPLLRIPMTVKVSNNVAAKNGSLRRTPAPLIDLDEDRNFDPKAIQVD